MSTISKWKAKAERILALADVRIDGNRPWDMQVHNDRLFARMLTAGSLGLGESYMDGWWDCARLDEFFCRILRARLDTKVTSRWGWLDVLRASLVNQQSGARAYVVGQRHYDIGNELYRCMLDKRLMYSCGFWEHALSLDEAQEAKLDLISRKLCLQPGMRVLDIGCGWGGLARFVAERYHVEVVGITVSREQARLARERCRGLPIEIRYQDYRSLNETYDRIVSIGMFEHVGPKNYVTFMNVVRRCLHDDGLSLLQTIGQQEPARQCDPWIARYIFPNSKLPAARQLCAAIEGRFVMENWENFGADYDTTLMHWYHHFEQSWPRLRDRYDERFFRMWKYYLLSCAGVFRSRTNQLWQVVLSPQGVRGGYHLAPIGHAASTSQSVNAQLRRSAQFGHKAQLGHAGP